MHTFFLHDVWVELNKVLVFEPFFSHMTPIYTLIDIPLARWHIDEFEKTNTEANLRKALERLPSWTKNFDWSYVQDESSENYLVAENTGLKVTIKCWEKQNLSSK